MEIAAAGNLYAFRYKCYADMIGGASGGLRALSFNDVRHDTVHWVCFDFPFLTIFICGNYNM